MSDVYSMIESAEPDLVERLADVLEVRAANSHQQEMLASYLAEIDFVPDAYVIEIGCGTGAVTRRVAAHPNVYRVVGIDASPIFIHKARALNTAQMKITFEQGDAHALAFPDATFDVAIFHTTLCHLLDPEKAMAEAFRILRPGGRLAIFEGDYASMTLATSLVDPLEVCVHALRESFIRDSWLGRRTPGLAQKSGFIVECFRSHAYSETTSPEYMLTVVDRGADTLAASGRIGQNLAEALKEEARRRIHLGEFFSGVTFTSLIARKEEGNRG
ncbi:MAG: methyltransferase domain-containing protein [Caldilineaceae bacterium]|nr:methyltransferase domain-containing protein [Caldilineaceae bacterium]